MNLSSLPPYSELHSSFQMFKNTIYFYVIAVEMKMPMISQLENKDARLKKQLSALLSSLLKLYAMKKPLMQPKDRSCHVTRPKQFRQTLFILVFEHSFPIVTLHNT